MPPKNLLSYFQKTKDVKSSSNEAATSKSNGTKDSKDKSLEKKPAPSIPQSKQSKEVTKPEPKKPESKKQEDPVAPRRNQKMEEEKPLPSGRRSQTPKSPQKSKQKEVSPSPPRRNRSGNNSKDAILDSVPSKKQNNTPQKKPQTPKKEEKKAPEQKMPSAISRNNSKNKKMEVENSGTEDLDDSKTQSLSEEEQVISSKKKVSGVQRKNIVISSDDDEPIQPPKPIKSLPPKSAQKQVNTKKAIQEYDEDSEEDNKKNSKGKVLGQPKRLVKGAAKNISYDDDEIDDDDEDLNQLLLKSRSTTNRTKAIAEKQEQALKQQKEAVQSKTTGTSAQKANPANSKSTAQQNTATVSTASTTVGSNKLAGQIIVFTGDFNGVSRETLAKIVTDHGAKNTGSVSGKTTLLVHGHILEDGRNYDQGKKYITAKDKGTQIMNQSEFSDFLKVKIGQSLEEITNSDQGGNRFDKFAANKNPVASTATNSSSSTKPAHSNPSADDSAPKKKILQAVNKPKEQIKYDPKSKQPAVAQGTNGKAPVNANISNKSMTTVTLPKGTQMNNPSSIEQLWTHKYAPSSINDCVGNGKNFEKMMEWLQDWVKVVIKGEKKKVKNQFYNRNMPQGDNTSNVNAKACLLSGPPGVGKTTSVRLIAEFMGYEVREWNASDQRSKKSVNNILGELKSNSILHLLKKDNPSDNCKSAEDEVEAKVNKKFVILMDEVDGMSSGDRGGNQALIDAIKNTNVPIFCICNDRMSPKVRSLANYCYDIKFVNPPKQDIAKYMKNICEKEGNDVDTEVIEQITERFGNDIRQTLNYLEMHFKTSKRLKNDDLTKLKQGQKDATVMLEAFEASTQLMQSYKFQKMSLKERIELFFVDYDLIPLLIHQNYLDTIQPRVEKSANKKDAPKQFTVGELENIAQATASIAESDLLSTQIRTNGNWALLPNLAFLSSIYPCDLVCEDKPIYPKFPEWLGKFMTTKKTTRELREFRVSISKNISGSRFAVKFDYVPVLLKFVLQMLKRGNDQDIEHVLNLMEYYNIKPGHLKEHLNDLQYPKADYYSAVSTNVKTQLTRQYNKRYSDDSRKLKGAKKSKKTEVSQGKYDKNLDDIVYSETEQQISGGEESGNDDSPSTPSGKQKQKLPKKITNNKKGAQQKNKKGNSKSSGTDELSEDEEGTNSLGSFIADDDE